MPKTWHGRGEQTDRALREVREPGDPGLELDAMRPGGSMRLTTSIYLQAARTATSCESAPPRDLRVVIGPRLGLAVVGVREAHLRDRHIALRDRIKDTR
jgi:hypothetical protein